MISENKIVTAPFGWPELASLLGAPIDEGQICKSPNINMWSRHKPVSFNKLGQLLELGENDSQVCEWKGDDRIHQPFGISMPMDASDIRLLKGLKIAYTNRPIGGMESPYRIHDFDGYNHKSLCPWTLRFPEGSMYKNQTNVLIYFHDTAWLPEGNLKKEDLMDENRKFIAIGVWDETSSAPAEMKTFPADSPSISLEGCNCVTSVTSEVELTMLAAFTNKEIREWSTEAEQTFYAIDCDSMPAMGHITVKPTEYKTTYMLTASFFDKSGKTVRVMRVSSDNQEPTDGRIYAIGTWFDKPTKDFQIKSVSIVAYDLEDPKIVLASGTTTDVSSVIPENIGRTDWEDIPDINSAKIQFRVDLMPTVANVSGVARYVYTLNYEEI